MTKKRSRKARDSTIETMACRSRIIVAAIAIARARKHNHTADEKSAIEKLIKAASEYIGPDP